MLNRLRRAPGLVVFLLLGITYGVTLAPSIGPGDSGELAAVMTSFGVAHAPGYPLLSGLGNIVHLVVRTGEPALVLNAMNAVMHALAAAFVAAAIFRATRSAAIAVILALALGVSRIYWEYSIAVEVFALNDLATAVLLWSLTAFRDSIDRGAPSSRLPMIAAATMSLAVTHHTTLALVALPVLLGFSLEIPRLKAKGIDVGRLVLKSLAAGAVGLLPLLYIPIAARRSPELSWDDARDVRGFIDLLLRKDFGSGRLMSSEVVAAKVLENGGGIAPGAWTHNLRFFTAMTEHAGWVFAALVFVGVIEILRRRRLRDVPLLAFALAQAFFFSRVNSPTLPLFDGVTERFYLMPMVLWTFVAAAGAARIKEILDRGPAYGGAVFLAVIAAGGPLFEAVSHRPRIAQCRTTFTRDLGRNFLKDLPPRAILFGQGDMLHSSVSYQRLALDYRTDVTYVDLQKLTYDWYVRELRRRGDLVVPESFTALSPKDPKNSLRALFDGNFGKRPIAVLRAEDTSWTARYRLSPFLLWSVLELKETPPAIADRARAAATAMSSMVTDAVERRYDPDRWENDEQAIYVEAYVTAAVLYEFADALARGSHDDAIPDEARVLLDRARRIGDTTAERVAEVRAVRFWTMLVEKTRGLEPAPTDLSMVEKARRLARSARGGPTGDALRTCIDLRNLRVSAASYDIHEDIEDHLKFLDKKSTDMLVLNALVTKTSKLLLESRKDETATFAATISRQARAVQAFREACATTENSNFADMLAILEKSLDGSRRSFEEYRRRFR